MLKESLGLGTGLLQDLHNDHQQVADLIEQMLKADDPRKRSAIFRQVMVQLLAHSEAEQAVLYRKLEKSDDETARQFAYEGDNEHQIVEQQLQQMSRARNKGSEQWTAQALVLQDLVSHHVDEEESTGFSCAKQQFDSDTLEQLGDQFRRQKQKLLTAG